MRLRLIRGWRSPSPIRSAIRVCCASTTPSRPSAIRACAGPPCWRWIRSASLPPPPGRRVSGAPAARISPAARRTPPRRGWRGRAMTWRPRGAAVAAAEYDGAPGRLAPAKRHPGALRLRRGRPPSSCARRASSWSWRAMDWAALAQRRASRASAEEGGWSLFPTAWVGADVLDPSLAAALNASGEGGVVRLATGRGSGGGARALPCRRERGRSARRRPKRFSAGRWRSPPTPTSAATSCPWRGAAPPSLRRPPDPVPFFWRMTPPE